MLYTFPHEDLFMAGVALLIIGLLILRVRVARQRRSSTSMDVQVETSSVGNQEGSPPFV